MPDNIELNAGSGGQTIRALDDGTTVFPVGVTAFAASIGTPDSVSIVTPTVGLPVRLADGSGYLSTLPVSLASVPSHAVTGPLTDAELRASAVPVSAASLPLPTGAATAANQTTANASLATLAGAVSGTEVQVDVLTMPTVAVTQSGTWNIVDITGTVSLPTGAATLAEQQSQTAQLTRLGLKYLDFDTGAGTDSAIAYGILLPGNGGSVIGGTASNPIRTDPTGTTTQPVSGTITANLGTIGGAATEATLATLNGKVTAVDTGAVVVTTLPALPAGTNNIGDVDVLSLPALPAGSNTIGAVNLAQYTPVTGRLPVDGSGVTQPISNADLTAAAGSLNVIDDWDESDRAKVNPIVGQAGVQGGSGAVSANTQRVVLAIDVALPTGSNVIGAVTQSGTWAVTGAGGTFPVTNAGTFAVQVDGAALTALQVIDNPVVVDDAAFTPATTSVTMAGFTFDDVSPDTVNEGDAGAARMSANRCQYVVLRDSAGNERGLNIDASGRLGVTLASAQTLATVTAVTGGGVAHDSPDSGNPHKIGGKAKSSLSAITLVSANDRTDLYADVDGVQLVRQDAPLADNVSGVASITDGSSTSVIAAQGSGVKTYITDVTISNTSATAVTVDLRDGTAGSVKWTFPVPANTAGVVYSFRRPLAFSANTAVAADPSAAASTITVSLGGFKSKV